MKTRLATGSPTQVVKIFIFSPKAGGQVFSGEPEEVVSKLVEEVKDIL